MLEEPFVPGQELLTTYTLPGFTLHEYRLLRGWKQLPTLVKKLEALSIGEVWVAGECFYGIYFATATSAEALLLGLRTLANQDLDAYKHPGVTSANAWGKGLQLSDFDPYFHTEPDLDRLLVGPEVTKRSSDE
jgi:hypothetical protein